MNTTQTPPTWYQATFKADGKPTSFRKCGDRILIRKSGAILTVPVNEAGNLISSVRTTDNHLIAVTIVPAPKDPLAAPIADGTYTVEKIDGTYVTLQVSHWAKAPEKQVVSYLAGPDNEADFQGFAFMDPIRGLQVWKKYRAADGKPSDAVVKYMVAVTVLQDPAAAENAGIAYAMKSGRCCRCNRTLTVPASLHRGMGPICAQGGTDA